VIHTKKQIAARKSGIRIDDLDDESLMASFGENHQVEVSFKVRGVDCSAPHSGHRHARGNPPNSYSHCLQRPFIQRAFRRPMINSTSGPKMMNPALPAAISEKKLAVAQ
jgi:hypothetical protein